jgi:hypothetical protein
MAPAKIFYPLAVVFLGAAFLYPSPLMPLLVFYAAILGAIWTFLISELQLPNPKVSEMFPLVMLLFFMGILSQVLGKPTSEPMYHAVRGLLMFRTLVYILRALRSELKPITPRTVVLVTLIAVEMFFIMVRVYHQIYQVGGGASIPEWLNWFETKVLAVGVAGLILHAYFEKRPKAV